MKYVSFVAGILLLACFAFGAGIDGKWAGSLPGMDGNNMTIEFIFKVDGTSLSGTHIVNGQQTAFKEGKIDGNNITFTVNMDMGGQPMKIDHKGTVSADQIKITYEMMGQSGDFVLKRAK